MPLSDPTSLAERRTFAPEDVFFSTTDRKGVIRHANHTFLRLAALTEDEAVGSPHNVIRHPDMPGGAFRLVWDELEAGRPVAFYIANEAKDGVRYDVLAAITPVDGGFLSIRLRPNLTDVQDRVFEAYDGVASRERDLRRTGAGRHSVAERGAVLLTRALASIGFASLADFTRTVLPREVEALVAELPRAVAPGPGAGALGVVLAASQEIGARTAAFASHLTTFEQTAQRIALEHDTLTPLVGELVGVRHELQHLAELLQQSATEREDPDLADLAELTRSMDSWCEDAVDGLESLPLERLQLAIRDLALRIAMFVLLNQMVSRFTSEVIAAGPDAAPRGTELRHLHAALEQQLDRAESGTARVAELLHVVPELTEVAVRGVDKVTLKGERWAQRLTAAATEGRLGDSGTEALALVLTTQETLRHNVTGLGAIVGLSARLKQTPVRFDPAELRGPLGVIGDGVATLP